MAEQQTVFERNPKKTILFVVLFFFLLVELGFRLVWNNAFTYPYTKLQKPLTDWVMNYSSVHEDGADIRFRTDDKREILSGKPYDPDLPDAFIFGGSTTESAAVQEGKRWPDLIKGYNTHNYGVGGNTILDSYYNLKWLYGQGIIKKGDTVFVMHSVNDWAELMGVHFGAEHPLVLMSENYHLPKIETRQGSEYYKEILRQFVLPHFYTVAFFWDLRARLILEKYNTMDLKNPILARNPNVMKMEALDDREFQAFAAPIRDLMGNRWKILEAFYNFTREKDLHLILLTQPDSYTEAFRIKNGIYTLPQYKGKRLTREQTRAMQEMTNRQTIDFARAHQIPLIDVATPFNRHDPNPLFYDQAHYTEKGSVLYAEIINEHLAKL